MEVMLPLTTHTSLRGTIDYERNFVLPLETTMPHLYGTIRRMKILIFRIGIKASF
jgi:hypothetical protein